MKCIRCEKEIKDESKFCNYCGAKQESSDDGMLLKEESPLDESTELNTDNEPTKVIEEEKNLVEASIDESDDKKPRKWIIPAVIGGFCVAIFIVAGISAMKPSGVQEIIDKQDEVVNETADEITESGKADNTTDEITESGKSDNTTADSETDEVEEVRDPEYFICVPVEELSLRETAGLGTDVITTLRTGEIVDYLFESETVNGIDFYKVKTLNSDEEGYVSSRAVVRHINECDETKLNIVDTTVQKYSYDMMVEDIYELIDSYPEMLRYEVIGQSYYGRDIYAITLGNEYADNHVFVQASIHGREYMTAQAVMRLLEYYACYYDDAKVGERTYRELFENTAFHVIPMSNPDGVTISQEGLLAMNDPEMYEYFKIAYEVDSYYMVYGLDSNGEYDWGDHYKDVNFVRDETTPKLSFEEYQTLWKANGRGVDLNNNFDADWENIDLKPYATYGSYKGEYPESEPETRALVEYARRYDYSCYISYHSRGQVVYYDCKGNSDYMSQAEEDFAGKVSNAIGYEKVKTQKGYNVNLGGFGDWVQLKLNKLSVTIENGKGACPLSIDEFQPIWLRHKEFWAYLADV